MKNILVRDLDDTLVESFKNEAKRRGTSLQAVLKQTLNDNRPKAIPLADVWHKLDELRAQSGPAEGMTGLELIAEGRREQDEKFARIFGWK
jgi:hypothetical protein